MIANIVLQTAVLVALATPGQQVNQVTTDVPVVGQGCTVGRLQGFWDCKGICVPYRYANTADTTCPELDGPAWEND